MRDDPWWFASVPEDPQVGGRFDLAAAMGTCHTGTSVEAVMLESLQAVLPALPIEELQVRRLAEITVPDGAADAADLTDPAGAGVGTTAAIWAGNDRALTQAWAQAFRRDGWWALHAGIDMSGRPWRRAVRSRRCARTQLVS